MWIFNRFKKKQTVQQGSNNEISEKKLLLGIAASLSYDDKMILSEMEACIWNTKQYFKNHCEHYEARGIKNADDIEKIRWFTLIDLLVYYRYICEFNWKCGRESFVYFLGKTLLVQSQGLPIEKEWLINDDNIVEWCRILEDKWKTKDISIAIIKIDNESYILFPIINNELNSLEKQMHLLGHQICKC